ncbi:transposase [Streptomyces davaonensis]|uniref:transposase n=1 Tax=Streptomyces davaonensis TaxID=348043 RepID=UPI0038B457B2
MVPLRGRLLPRQGAKRGLQTGPSPVDRGQAGSKHHLITDGHGTPLAVVLTGGNRNDVTQLMPLLDAIPPVRGRRGRPRRKPDALLADRGYDHDRYRERIRARRILPVVARRGTPHGSGLGRYRWVAERTFAWLPAPACALGTRG